MLNHGQSSSLRHPQSNGRCVGGYLDTLKSHWLYFLGFANHHLPNVNPPVCKILDYAKFKYEQKKKQKEIKANAAKVVLKEIRFGPNTDDHDFNFKLKHAINFLKEGAKVKAYVHFVGRSIVFKERGEMLLLKFAQALEDYGAVEQLPKLEGKRMNIFIAPKQSKK